MGKKSNGYVKINVPKNVFQALEEVSEAKGKTAEEMLMSLVFEEQRKLAQELASLRAKPKLPPARRFKTVEERLAAIEAEADEMSRDPGQLEALREWEGPGYHQKK